MRNLIISAFILLSISAKAQDYNQFFPLQIGNTYTYSKNNSTIISYTIEEDTLIFGKKYFRTFFPSSIYSLGSNGIVSWFRVDSTGSIFRFDSTNGCSTNYFYDKLIDTLGAEVTGQILLPPCTINLRCDGNDSITAFGYNFERKNFYRPFLLADENRWFLKGIGLYRTIYISQSTSTIYQLKGCVINGILYGDTSTTNIISISSNTPMNFFLYQNYPNPFNPSTIIKFDIQRQGHSKLIIYNSLGVEVQKLFDKEFQEGSYQISFDASNYPSGVYFYKLSIGKLTFTRKMVVVK